MKQCNNCGSEIFEGEKFCQNCGASQIISQSVDYSDDNSEKYIEDSYNSGNYAESSYESEDYSTGSHGYDVDDSEDDRYVNSGYYADGQNMGSSGTYNAAGLAPAPAPAGRSYENQQNYQNSSYQPRPGYSQQNNRRGQYDSRGAVNPNQINQYNLPEKYKPVSSWGYIGYNILFSLPIVGFILAIVFAVSDKKINRRNYARAQIIIFLFGIIFAVIIYFLVRETVAKVIQYFEIFVR